MYKTDEPSAAKKTAHKQSEVKAPKGSSGTKPLSVREFILQVGTKKHTETVLAFGYYLEKHIGLKEFTAADLNSCYYDSKMESSNTSQMIVHNIRSRRLMEAKKKKGEKGRKAYILTGTGEEFIEKKLNKTDQPGLSTNGQAKESRGQRQACGYGFKAAKALTAAQIRI